MTLRKVLIIPFLIAIAFFVVFSVPIFGDTKFFMDGSLIGGLIVPGVIGAIIVQFVAHYIRAYKMRYLMDRTVNTSSGLQFRALSIGYLFDMILPFRIGELIRAQVVAYAKSISFGFSLALVVVERTLDLVFLSLFGGLFVLIGIFPTGVIPYLAISSAIGVAIIIVIAMIWREYVPFMSLVRRFSNVFNESLKVQMRFKYWSIMYGLQQTITKGRVVKYVILTFIMWAGYALSVLVLLLSMKSEVYNAVQVFSPFYAVSVPSGPANLESYSHIYSQFTQNSFMADKTLVLVTWVFLIVPMSLVGLYNLALLKTPVWRKLQNGFETDDLVNKLSRKRDISRGLALFLDNYLDGNSLSRIVNRRERQDDFKLVRYFKGGSDAITILVNSNRRNIVEKIIALDLKDRLKAQYDWLVEYRDPHIIEALGDTTGDDYYAIELDYDKENDMFFDYIHRSSLKESKRVMDDIWSTLNRTVHKKGKRVTDVAAVKKYIDKHFYGCLEKSLDVSDDLKAVIGQDEITINGRRYLNAYAVMDKIMENKDIMKEIGTYTHSGAVHGDVIVDNILVNRSTGSVTIIDPAPDGNIINGRVFDFGKNMQSLYCGYEFLFRGSEPALLGDDGSISYRDEQSLRYTQLCDYVRNVLAPQYLSEPEQRAMIFHAGILMMRRLKHQVYQDPKLTLAMYAAGVKTLNDFYAMY